MTEATITALFDSRDDGQAAGDRLFALELAVQHVRGGWRGGGRALGYGPRGG
jgi:hypothetical protein